MGYVVDLVLLASLAFVLTYGWQRFYTYRHAPKIKRQRLLYAAWLVFLFAGCRCQNEMTPAMQVASSGSGASETSSAPLSPEQLVERGRTVYAANCTACHNANPKMAGSVGPEVYASTKELLELRIMSAGYPNGYVPKRKSHAMAPLPYLKNDVEAIFRYLNAP